MYLKKLKLENFRTYENLELKFENNINVFFGENAEGKTNILESIYISSITKSYRTNKDIECIKFKKDFLRLNHSYIGSKEKNIDIEVYIDNNSKKQIKEDNIKIGKYSDFLGKIPIIMFSPDNINIVKGSPKERRKFLDILISQISKKYVICLQEYNKLINLKNSLLKNDRNNIDINYLEILDEKLSEKIEYIASMRNEYLNRIENKAVDIQKELSNNEEKLKLKYESEFINKDKKQIKEILYLSRENDIYRKTSNKGIGHDDIIIFVNDKEVYKYGSQGQKRTSLLSLKLAEFEILKNEKDETPIILLDDVFSELDINRINFLMKYISNYQVFITTTEIDSIKNIKNKSLFKVKKGIVEKINN